MASELLLLVLVVALFGGDAIAGEASWGNLRYLLMRPITALGACSSRSSWSRWCTRGSAWRSSPRSGAIAGGIAFGFEGVSATP